MFKFSSEGLWTGGHNGMSLAGQRAGRQRGRQAGRQGPTSFFGKLPVEVTVQGDIHNKGASHCVAWISIHKPRGQRGLG